MARYWMTPVNREEPLVLGADRQPLPEGEALDAFRQKLQRDIHPRFLPMVKASILPGEPVGEQEYSCGSEEAPNFAEPGDVVFDGITFGLSECGRAFIDRLPLLREQVEWLERALSIEAEEGWNEQEGQWLQAMAKMVRSGRTCMLVKEE